MNEDFQRKRSSKVGDAGVTDNRPALKKSDASTRTKYSIDKSIPERSREDLKKGYKDMGKITDATKSDRGFA